VLHALPAILDADELRQARTWLADDAPWSDGRASAGAQAAELKHNEQLPHDCPQAERLRALVLAALDRSPAFFALALPRRLSRLGFNRYRAAHGGRYGAHIDNAVRAGAKPGEHVRTDLSCTLFLCEPQDYEGGELVVDCASPWARSVKLAAGSLVVYPAGSLHEVRPVTRGTRLACFFWVQSMVRGAAERQCLWEMDGALTRLRAQPGADAEALMTLSGCYHRLLGLWAET
jgi:PKHD-type hydroxylase